ncbi:hypothetical protein HDU97_009163 [Phlyctochytrium planicorne]|nr:hypothetical protein HDU97_009163 [Phlyctochytrium planicorne]
MVHAEIMVGGRTLKVTFVEVMNGYRKINVLTLEFKPSPWDEIVRDIRLDFERTKIHASLLKSGLIQCLDLVSKRQPMILLSGGIPDPQQPNQPQSWKDLISDLLPSRRDETEENNGGFLTDEEKILRKKIFVLLTVPRQETVEVAYIKSTIVRVEGYPTAEDSSDQRVTFTIYSKGPKLSHPTSFLLNITSPHDVFLNFTSSDITPETFQALTQHIDIVDPTIPSSPASRDSIMGFLRTEGVGGVVGILGRDFLDGLDGGERYAATFKVVNDFGGGEKDGPPPLRTGRLVLMEKVLFRVHEVMRMELMETGREQVKAEVQDRYMRLKDEIDWTQHRLDALLDAVRRKTPTLLSLLAAIPIPRSFTSTTRRYKKTSSTSVPILEPASEDPNKRDPNTGRFRHAIVPSNTVKPYSVTEHLAEEDEEENDDDAGAIYRERAPVLLGGPGETARTGRSWSPSKIPVQVPRKGKAQRPRRSTPSPTRSPRRNAKPASPPRRSQLHVKTTTSGWEDRYTTESPTKNSSPLRTSPLKIVTDFQRMALKSSTRSPTRSPSKSQIGDSSKSGRAQSARKKEETLVSPIWAGGPAGIRPWPIPISPMFD